MAQEIKVESGWVAASVASAFKKRRIPEGLIDVISVYGRHHLVSVADFDNKNRTQLPIYTKTGRRYSDTPRGIMDWKRGRGTTHIHRDNINQILD
jgi:hypothetical protein